MAANSSNPKLYAVGVSPGWVEIRSSLTPPKPRISRASKDIEFEHQQGRYEMFTDTHGFRRIRYITDPPTKTKSRLNLQVTIMNGGRVIKSMLLRQFYDKTARVVDVGQIYELQPIDIQRLRLKVKEEE